MQGIYTYIPETNYVPREYNVAAILLLLFMVLISLVSVLNLLYFYISTFRSMWQWPLWLCYGVPWLHVFLVLLLLLLLLLYLKLTVILCVGPECCFRSMNTKFQKWRQKVCWEWFSVGMSVLVSLTSFVPNISCSDQYAASIFGLGAEVLVKIFRSK
jgi:hypothetical protein